MQTTRGTQGVPPIYRREDSKTQQSARQSGGGEKKVLGARPSLLLTSSAWLALSNWVARLLKMNCPHCGGLLLSTLALEICATSQSSERLS